VTLLRPAVVIDDMPCHDGLLQPLAPPEEETCRHAEDHKDCAYHGDDDACLCA